MAESESNRGKSLALVEELRQVVSRGLQAQAKYLFRAWGLSGSVQDLRKAVGLESSQPGNTAVCGVVLAPEPEEGTNA